MSTTAGVLTVLAVAALALSGPGTRWGWWHFRTGLLLFAVSGVLALAALIFAAIAWKQSPRAAGGLGLVAVAVAALVGSAVAGASRKPAIHDISTDLDEPPHFQAVLPLRGASSNRVNGIDPATAAAQRRAYGDVQPLMLAVTPAEAYARALAAARSSGWTIVAANEGAGTIEATDTTRFFGFSDDIVVRIRPAASGSRIDVRSTSRVGRSDVGVNAARIRGYLGRL